MNVIATGMVSAVGYDARTVCAAARAGVTRAGELPFLTLESDMSPGLAVGHVAGLLTDGFEGDARLVRLLGGALTDLVTRVPEAQLAGPRVAYYLSIPAIDRDWQGLGLIATQAGREQYLERLGPPPVANDAARGRALIDKAMRFVKVPPPVREAARTVRVSTAGHAAAIGLFSRAQVDLDAGNIDVAVVGGVDTLVDPAALSWLSLTGRLKSAESPAGLSPGEAAAFVVLGKAGASARSDQPARASIGYATTRSSATHLLSAEPADGQSQFEIANALGRAIGGSELSWVVSDQNGEMFRAVDWGNTLVRLRAAGLSISEAGAVWYPASSVGDVGAATGVVATCLAAEAFVRGYAPARHAILLASSDGPPRAGCVMSALEN